MSRGGPELELRVARRPHPQQRVVSAIVQLETGDRLRVTAIQAFRKAEDRRERANRSTAALAELAEGGVTPLRSGLTMVARDERDRFDVVRLEAAKIAVLDQIVRVLVMTLVADVDADVVQQRRVFQPFALAIGQSVDGARLIEERQGQTRHLAGVFRPVVAALGELDDAAPPHVGIAIDLGDLPAVARDVIEDQAFTQRQIAQRELARAETADDRIEQYGACHGEIRSPRLESGNPQTCFQIERDERLPHAPELFGRDPAVPERRARRIPLLGRDDRAEAEDGARRANQAVEAGPRDLIEVLPELRVDVFQQLAFVATRQGIALDEPLSEADDAKLEAATEIHVCTGGPAQRGCCVGDPGASRDLDAASADVDNHRGRAGNADAVRGGEMDEPRLFGSRDDARPDARFLSDRVQELAAVLGFASGAGGDGHDLVDAVRLGERAKLRQHLEGGVHGRRRQRPAVEPARSEPDHFLFAIDDFEGQIGAHLHHEHVQRVGPDVDGGNAHVRGTWRPTRYVASGFSRTQTYLL